MSQQLNHLKQHALGFDREQIIVASLNNLTNKDQTRMLELMKHNLLDNPQILGVSGASRLFNLGFGGGYFRSHNGESIRTHHFAVDADYFNLMGIDLIAGEPLTPQRPGAVLVNEAWLEKFGWDTHVGKHMERMRISDAKYGRFKNPEVIGVIRNFNLATLHTPIDPAVFVLTSNPYYLYIKIRSEHISETLDQVESIWATCAGDVPFEHFFLDDYINRQYKTETLWGQIIGYSATFAILIAALGAFGLTALAVSQRTKEIGIRKALGATAQNIILLLSKDLLKLVLLANLIGWPLTYYVMDKWLANFAYRISLGVDAFLFGGFLTMGIALITVGFQVIKAARSNPVDALRYE